MLPTICVVLSAQINLSADVCMGFLLKKQNKKKNPHAQKTCWQEESATLNGRRCG